MIELAQKNALAVGAGHTFFIFLGEGFYPINILNAVKNIPEVCRVFCASANPVKVMLADDGEGRGVLGVIDGLKPQGIEAEADISWRKGFLRQIGYKAG
jgi:adenosine/AMP kinase